MKYEFVHKRNSDWCFEELRIINELVALVNDPDIKDPVMAIGQHLAVITKVKYLIIGRALLPYSYKVRTACFLNQGHILPNTTYSLQNTPCQNVFDYGVCYYPFGVKEEFPLDQDLVRMNVNSYMGTVLNDNDGNRIGLIVLLNETPIPNPGFIEHLLTIVSPVLEQKLAEAIEETVSTPH